MQAYVVYFIKKNVCINLLFVTYIHFLSTFSLNLLCLLGRLVNIIFQTALEYQTTQHNFQGQNFVVYWAKKWMPDCFALYVYYCL